MNFELISEEIQTPSQFSCQSHIQQAGDVVAKLQFSLKNLKNFQAVFSQQSYTVGFDNIDVADGIIYFQKPTRFRFDYKSPENKTFLLLDKKSFIIDHSTGRIEKEILDQELSNKFPLASILDGNLNKHFRLISICSNTDGIVFKFARDENANQSYELSVLTDLEIKMLLGVMFKDFGGAVNLFTFRDPTTNDLPKTLFTEPKV